MADADYNDEFFGTTHSIQCGWAWKWGCLRAHVQQVSRELLNRKRAPSWNVTCCVNLVRVVPVLALFMFWSHSAIRNYKETRSGSWSDFVRPPKGVGTGYRKSPLTLLCWASTHIALPGYQLVRTQSRSGVDQHNSDAAVPYSNRVVVWPARKRPRDGRRKLKCNGLCKSLSCSSCAPVV